jgi:hypothetical protein
LTIELRAGDWLVETEDLVHYRANRGNETVVVTLAALIAQGAPLATPVGEVPTPPR